MGQNGAKPQFLRWKNEVSHDESCIFALKQVWDWMRSLYSGGPDLFQTFLACTDFLIISNLLENPHLEHRFVIVLRMIFIFQ